MDNNTLSSLIEFAPVGIFKVDANGMCLFVNPAWCKIAGISHEEAMGVGWVNAIHPEDRQMVFDKWSTVINNQTGFLAEYRYLTADGVVTWVLEHAIKTTDNSGQLSGYIGTITNINEKKSYENSLLMSQAIAHLGSWELDLSNHTLHWSDETCRIFGLTPHTSPTTYEQFIQRVHPDDQDKLQKRVKRALAEATYNYQIEHRIVRPDKSERIVFERGVVKRNSQGHPERMVGTIHDITEMRSIENQLQLIQMVLDQTHEGVFISDEKGQIISVNTSLCRLYGYTAEEIIGNYPNLFKSNHHDLAYYSLMWKTMLQTGAWEGEIWNRRKNGEVFPVKSTIQAIRDHEHHIKHFLCVYHDLTDIKQRDEKLAYSTTHDALTGLPNRRLFLDLLQQAVQQAQRDNSRIGVTVLDIDFFKKVNDSLGYARGDTLLQMIAKRIQNCARKVDTICRLGGDEFAIIHPKAGHAENIAQMTQRLLGELAKPFQVEDQELHLSASIGVTIVPEDGLDPELLLKNADLAMHQAKKFGRSNFQFFTKSLDERAVQRLAMENEIRVGIKQEQFLLHHQPKVDLVSKSIVGMEALVRWSPYDKTLISPAEFIPVAEETNLIVPLGEWVLRAACVDTARWHSLHPNLRVAVNISPRQFQEKNFFNCLESALNDSQLPPEYLELEITESMLVDNVDETIALLKQIKNRGISIAMDDFGTGYSSLSVLKRFPIDTLKIDQSFVRDLAIDSDDAQIVAAIISMAHSLNLKVVAEGVETKEQLEFLCNKKCDIIQGYYFSKPLPVNQFTQLLIKGKGL